MNHAPVWIIDDDKSIRWVLEKALARENRRLMSHAAKSNDEQDKVVVPTKS